MHPTNECMLLFVIEMEAANIRDARLKVSHLQRDSSEVNRLMSSIFFFHEIIVQLESVDDLANFRRQMSLLTMDDGCSRVINCIGCVDESKSWGKLSRN